MDIQDVLNCEMQINDAGAATIKEYLRKLLSKLWAEGESFSGKRPFGNSDWDYELYPGLVKAGLVEGTLCEYGHIEEIDRTAAEKLIFDAIEAL